MRRNTAQAVAASVPSTSIRKYMDGKISASDYFREVREKTARRVERELKTPKKEQKS